MTQTGFQAVRNVLRWSGIGVNVSAARVDEALSEANKLPRGDLNADAVRTALLTLRGGVQVSQRDCILAERSLSQAYIAQAADDQDDSETSMEVQRV